MAKKPSFFVDNQIEIMSDQEPTTLPRIFADFNTMGIGEGGRVLIYVSGATNPNKEVAQYLQVGARVLLFEGETAVLEVEAVLEFDEQYGVWWGRPDESTWQHSE